MQDDSHFPLVIALLKANVAIDVRRTLMHKIHQVIHPEPVVPEAQSIDSLMPRDVLNTLKFPRPSTL